MKISLTRLGLADELAPHREEGGDDAGDVGRRHAGAAVLDVLRSRPASPRAFFSGSPAAHERIFSPGATRSGLSRPSPVGPFDEKYDTP